MYESKLENLWLIVCLLSILLSARVGAHYLIPLVLLLFHSKDGVDMVFKELIRQLTQTGMVLKSKVNLLSPQSQ